MLKIKLARFGKRNQPHYRIVVTEARSKRDGKYSALLGHYAPAQSPKVLEIDAKAYKEWLDKGAQPTPTVEDLFKRYESKDPFPPKKPKPSKKSLAKKAGDKDQSSATKKDEADKKVEKEDQKEAKGEKTNEKPA